MRIAFIHRGLAALPELEAYTGFFTTRGHETYVITRNQPVPMGIDAEWHFMGLGGKRMFPGSILIHEYASASVPPMSYIKDRAKQLFNNKPDLRIYQNEFVRKSLGFNDGIPFGFRDMGINLDLINSGGSVPKTIDFIYPGSVRPYSYFRKLLQKFSTGALRQRSLLVISELEPAKQAEWAPYPNIKFSAMRPNAEVLELIRSSRFGINYRPPVLPYNFQTSTKLLEFAACRVPVVTTPSPWLQQFQQAHGGSYFILSPDLGNLTEANLEKFQFDFPDLESCSWENQIIRSGICEFLKIS